MNVQQQRQATHKQRKVNVARKNKAKQGMSWRERKELEIRRKQKQTIYNRQLDVYRSAVPAMLDKKFLDRLLRM